MKTQFNVKPTANAKQFMQMSGVPLGLLSDFTVDLNSAIKPIEHEKYLLSIKQQVLFFHQMCNNFEKPFVGVISSTEHYLQARKLATLIFWQHLQNAINNNAKGATPNWINVSNDFKNDFLDEYKSGHYSSSLLLCIDNVYQDMPTHKSDKINDILQIMCDRPRLILFRGNSPYKFCLDTFGVRPNMILNMSKPNSGKKVQL